MRRVFILFFLLRTTLVFTQVNTATPASTVSKSFYDSLPLLNKKGLDIYLDGYKNIKSNGLPARAIYFALLEDGFELKSNDSLVRIKKFTVSFDGLDKKKNIALNEFPSAGPFVPIGNDAKTKQLFKKIRYSTIVTIDTIIVEYLGKLYKIKSQEYYDRDDGKW